MADLTQDPTFRIFVAGFAASSEGYNCEYMAAHLAPLHFDSELSSAEQSLDDFVAYCAGQDDFVRLFDEFRATYPDGP